MTFGLRSDFSLTTLETRRYWNNAFNSLRENTYLSGVVYSEKNISNMGVKQRYFQELSLKTEKKLKTSLSLPCVLQTVGNWFLEWREIMK